MKPFFRDDVKDKKSRFFSRIRFRNFTKFIFWFTKFYQKNYIQAVLCLTSSYEIIDYDMIKCFFIYVRIKTAKIFFGTCYENFNSMLILIRNSSNAWFSIFNISIQTFIISIIMKTKRIINWLKFFMISILFSLTTFWFNSSQKKR